MIVITDDDLVFDTFPKQKLTDGDTAYVVIPEYTGSQNFISFETTVGMNSHPNIYHYFSTRRLANIYCNFKETGKIELDMSNRQIAKGLNSQDNKYLPIGTTAFRTTELGSIIRCKIGKGSNPWKYKYFTTREAGNKYITNPDKKEVEQSEETKAEVLEDLSNYDKEAILKTTPAHFSIYGDEYDRDNTFSGREKYLDKLEKIKFGDSTVIKDLSDIFYWLIIKSNYTYFIKSNVTHCESNRARTADDLYLLAKYKYNIDVTFEECYKILCRIRENQSKFHLNFNINMSWCSTVLRIVTSINFPIGKSIEDFRLFFNQLKINKNVNG